MPHSYLDLYFKCQKDFFGQIHSYKVSTADFEGLFLVISKMIFWVKQLKHSQIGYKIRPRNRISKNWEDVNSTFLKIFM